MLVQARLEIGEACLELGKLLLVLGNNRQQRYEGVLHEGWCGGPLVGRDTIWWRQIVHAASMLGVGVTVKQGDLVATQPPRERLP
jgi:hypothetical protein